MSQTGPVTHPSSTGDTHWSKTGSIDQAADHRESGGIPSGATFEVGRIAQAPTHLDRIGPTVSSIATDLIEPDAARLVVDTVLERHGRLDGLVNNVGAIKTRKGFLEQRQPGARRQRGGPAPGHPGDRLRSDEDGPRFRT